MNSILNVTLAVLFSFSSTASVYVAGIGDSIMAGHGTSPHSYTSAIEGGPSGDTNMSPMHVLEWFSGGRVASTNLGHGGYMWSQVEANILSHIPSGTRAVIAHCGVNDISNGVAWNTALTSINSCKSYADSIGARFFIDSVFPDTNFDDTKAATVRTWNANYANWASTNGAYFINTHDLMGQLRISTGFLDDLKYNCGDGIHTTTNGVAVWVTNMWNIVATVYSQGSFGALRAGKISAR